VTKASFGGAIRTAASIIAVIALAACTSTTGGSAGVSSPSAAGSPAGSPAAASPLEGTFWTLTEYLGPDGNAVPVPAAVAASATFAAGTVSGNAGCNDYTGGYTVDGDKLTFGAIASTKKACGPAETALETAYLAALAKVATFSVSADTLELKTGEGKVGLKYAAVEAATLTGTRWVATSVNNGTGGVVSVIADTSMTAIFGTDGKVAGSGGCNDFNGPYTSDASTIKIGPLASTMKLCNTPEGIDAQEAQYFAALGKATTYAIAQATVLELRDAGGALQVSFRPTVN
jgi:heat shock protein HslJ